MDIKDLLKEDSIILNVHNQNKNEAIERLVDKHFSCEHITDKEMYKKAIFAREELSSTGVGGFIAIPHAQDESVKYPSLVAMVDKEGVDFLSMDQQPAKVFFMIAVPKEGGNQHLEILAQLSQILMNEKTVERLIHAQTPKHFINILTEKMSEEHEEQTADQVDVVAVTACPTGIAHTYMAAKSLEEAAKRKGIKIKIETNGASGIKNQLTPEDIEAAKCVIVAADKKVEMKRFAHKHLIQVPVAKGIHEADELIESAINQDADIYMNNQKESTQNKVKHREGKGIKKIYNHLMNGISHIIPLLMIYGVAKALMNIILPTGTYYGEISGQGVWQTYVTITPQFVASLSLILLSAYIADSISDQPGFVVGLVSAAILSIYIQSILLAILIGFLAGYIVKLLTKICSYLPEDIQSIVPNIILPIGGTFIMVVIINFFGMNMNMEVLNVSNQINENLLLLIGIVLGAMMSIDMGGPINKIAYTVGIISIFYNQPKLMSAVMIGGMVPPLAIGISMFVSSKLFESSQKAKWQCIIKGLCFVSEEAIPYMSSDRKGVHIPCIIASGIAGGLSVYFECGQLFPHGGIFTVALIDNPLFFVIALVSSSLIGASLILIFKNSNE